MLVNTQSRVVGCLLQENCEYDSVDVRGGTDPKATLHGTFCGSQIPPPVTSEGNVMRITFTSDSTVQKGGFVAVFFTGKLFFNLYFRQFLLIW
jgi:hypothetical protein